MVERADREISSGLRLSPSNLLILVLSLAAGFAVFSFDPNPRTIVLFILGAATLVGLLVYPEFALALYLVAGDVKGDERIGSLLPWDLTLVLGAVLLAGMALNLVRRKRVMPMPNAFYLLIALVAMMTTSLGYTPVFESGLEKLARFLTVTGIVIVAPFVVLGTPRAMQRFLVGVGVLAFAICSLSLTGLGGPGRLVTPSDNTIGLGHVACLACALTWIGILPRHSFPNRIFVYLLFIVPMVALIGAGSRGPVIAFGIVVVAGVVFDWRRLFDLLYLGVLGMVSLPFIKIPQSSLEYLGTMIGVRSISSLMDFRTELLDYGWKLLQQHPLVGTGIDGYRYYSPNSALYKWPHNIFLEVACELGIPAGLIVCALFASALRESWRQLKDKRSPRHVFSQLAAALLVIGIVNAMNTGDINSDRSTWLFLSLVFVVRSLRTRAPVRIEAVTRLEQPALA